ncbi:MAG: hypothetical protein AAGA54_04560 [Myxococcota bacterium]
MNAPVRPGFAVGHLSLTTPNLEQTVAFFSTLRARAVFQTDGMAILEIRGGTHLVVRTGAAVDPSFDLMVDEVDDVHAELAEQGYAVTELQRGKIHTSFAVTDGAGLRHRITSSHVVGQV